MTSYQIFCFRMMPSRWLKGQGILESLAIKLGRSHDGPPCFLPILQSQFLSPYISLLILFLFSNGLSHAARQALMMAKATKNRSNKSLVWQIFKKETYSFFRFFKTIHQPISHYHLMHALFHCTVYREIRVTISTVQQQNGGKTMACLLYYLLCLFVLGRIPVLRAIYSISYIQIFHCAEIDVLFPHTIKG